MNVREAMWHCATVLEEKEIESPKLSAEILTSLVTNLTKEELYVNLNRDLSPFQEAKLMSFLKRREKHEPIPYLTEGVEFYSISFHIIPGVLIPRPETETLVDITLDIAKTMACPKILDLGTGTGCIIISLALNLDDGEFWATDISSTAYHVARRNMRRHDLQNYLTVLEGSLFGPMRTALVQDFDILVSNPPYIKSGEIDGLAPQVRDYEPVLALDGGREGMTVINSILDGAPLFLKKGGYVILEIEPSLVLPIRTEVRRRGFREFKVHRDLSGKERFVQFRTKPLESFSANN